MMNSLQSEYTVLIRHYIHEDWINCFHVRWHMYYKINLWSINCVYSIMVILLWKYAIKTTALYTRRHWPISLQYYFWKFCHIDQMKSVGRDLLSTKAYSNHNHSHLPEPYANVNCPEIRPSSRPERSVQKFRPNM